MKVRDFYQHLLLDLEGLVPQHILTHAAIIIMMGFCTPGILHPWDSAPLGFCSTQMLVKAQRLTKLFNFFTENDIFPSTRTAAVCVRRQRYRFQQIAQRGEKPREIRPDSTILRTITWSILFSW